MNWGQVWKDWNPWKTYLHIYNYGICTFIRTKEGGDIVDKLYLTSNRCKSKLSYLFIAWDYKYQQNEWIWMSNSPGIPSPGTQPCFKLNNLNFCTVSFRMYVYPRSVPWKATTHLEHCTLKVQNLDSKRYKKRIGIHCAKWNINKMFLIYGNSIQILFKQQSYSQCWGSSFKKEIFYQAALLKISSFVNLKFVKLIAKQPLSSH